MPGGRPSLYEPRFCEMLIEHMKKGFSFETFAPTIGIKSDKTLWNWCEAHEEFLLAKKEAELHGRFFWESQGIRALWTEKDGMSFNATVWIFNMKNRFGWRDKPPEELKDDHRDQKTSFTPEEFVELVKAARGKD